MWIIIWSQDSLGEEPNVLIGLSCSGCCHLDCFHKLFKWTCPGLSVHGSHCLVHTATTSSQYSLVRPPRSVSKRLIFHELMWCGYSASSGCEDVKGYIFTVLCKQYVLLMLPCTYYSIFWEFLYKKVYCFWTERLSSHMGTHKMYKCGVSRCDKVTILHLM